MSLGYSLGGRHKGGCIEIQARGENAVITIGRGVATNNNIMLCAMNNIRIGDNVLIGERVTIMDFEAHGVPPNKRHEIGIIGEVVIAENVWIGNNATILKNTYIGENTIVAAGAVVSGRFPANVIIGGIPAKVIKHLPNE
jgi:acetyltransferase-like isoleucine patch superfamily enzyme